MIRLKSDRPVPNVVVQGGSCKYCMKILSHTIDHAHNSPDNEDLNGFTLSFKLDTTVSDDRGAVRQYNIKRLMEQRKVGINQRG